MKTEHVNYNTKWCVNFVINTYHPQFTEVLHEICGTLDTGRINKEIMILMKHLSSDQ
jgi:hypothetical protein